MGHSPDARQLCIVVNGIADSVWLARTFCGNTHNWSCDAPDSDKTFSHCLQRFRPTHAVFPLHTIGDDAVTISAPGSEHFDLVFNQAKVVIADYQLTAQFWQGRRIFRRWALHTRTISAKLHGGLHFSAEFPALTIHSSPPIMLARSV
jgi:hypothetical protein